MILGTAIAVIASLHLPHRVETIVLLTVLAVTAIVHRRLAPVTPRGHW